MNQSRQKRNRHESRLEAGFTLIELLTVIVIISLLVAILVPTVRGSIMAMKNAETANRLSSIITAVHFYRNEHQYYPDQPYTSQLTGGGGSDTGSQWLAKAMFTDINTGAFPTDAYLPLEEHTLATIDGRANTIADTFHPNEMAICYYVSRIGQTDLTQFVEGDNTAYTSGHTGTRTFTEFITDERITSPSTTPYNTGEFILIAPGIDRTYFTNDDLKNW